MKIGRKLVQRNYSKIMILLPLLPCVTVVVCVLYCMFAFTFTVTSFCFPKKKNQGLSDASSMRMGWMMFIASKTGWNLFFLSLSWRKIFDPYSTLLQCTQGPPGRGNPHAGRTDHNVLTPRNSETPSPWVKLKHTPPQLIGGVCTLRCTTDASHLHSGFHGVRVFEGHLWGERKCRSDD